MMTELVEWYEEYQETDKGHRHLSHLYGAYPGSLFYGNDKLWESSGKVVEARAKMAPVQLAGVRPWIAAMSARFHDSAQATEFLDILLGYSAPNLFDVYNDSKAPFVPADTYIPLGKAPEIGWFQIDGNFWRYSSDCGMSAAKL